MIVCKFNLSELGCKMGRTCAKLHPVDITLAKAEYEAKRTYIVCQSYLQTARCDNANCGLLHVSGALGPALELPLPENGFSTGHKRDTDRGARGAGRNSRSGGRNNDRAPRNRPDFNAPEASERRNNRNTAGRRAEPPEIDSQRHSTTPRSATPRNAAPRTVAPRDYEDRPTTSRREPDDPFNVYKSLGQTRGKLRQIIDAHGDIQKYAELTQSKEAARRLLEILNTLTSASEGIATLNNMLDTQISLLKPGEDPLGEDLLGEDAVTAVHVAEPVKLTVKGVAIENPGESISSTNGSDATMPMESMLAALNG